MGWILKIFAVLVGVFMMCMVTRTAKQKKMNEVQSIFWFIGAIGIIFMGLFPGVLAWMANILGVWWAPAILILCAEHGTNLAGASPVTGIYRQV